MAQEADLLIEAGFSDAKLAQEANRLMAKYKQAGERAQKAFHDAQGAVGDNQKLRAHMREIDKLSRAYDPVYVATKKYEGAIASLEKALAANVIDQTTYTAKLTEARTELGRISGAVQDTATKSRGFGNNMSNIGFQIGDFATQVGAGTSATQALGQQLPQLLGGFGAIGAVAGAAAAIMIPLGAAILKTAFDSETLEERMKGLEASTDAMTSAAEAAAVPIGELRARYGDLADEIARTNGAMASFAARRAQDDLMGAAKSTAGLFGDLVMPAVPLGLDGTPNADRLQQAERAQARALERLRRETGATEDQMEGLVQAIRRLETANGVDAVARDSENLLSVLAGIAANADANIEKLGTFADAVAAVNRVAREQIEAQRQVTVRQSEVIAKYAETTTKLKELAAERAILEEAVKSADKAMSDSAKEAIRNLDQQIAKTKELAAANDEMMTKGTLWSGPYQAPPSSAPSATVAAREMISGFEGGFVAKPYWDVNKYRAGYGSETYTGEDGIARAVVQGMLVAKADADRDLDRRILAYFEEQRKVVGPAWISFTDAQKAALASIQHNYGSIPGRIQPALASGDAQAIANAIAGLAMDYTRTEARDGSPLNYNRRMKEAAAFGSTEVAGDRNQGTLQALRQDIAERERQLKVVKDYGAQLAQNLVTQEQQAALDRTRAASLQAIEAAGLDGPAKAAAIAQVTAEYEKQRLVLTLTEDAKRRQVDLDTLMTGSTMTYAQAIAALGEARAANVIVEQQEAAAMERLAERQAFQNNLQQQFKDGLVDAIVAGESFRDVLGGIADALAKAALQAALFGEGPMAGANAGGGLLGGLMSFLGGIGKRAAGGPISANTPYLVGERGPEIIVPRSAGQVIPNNRISGGGGSMALTIDLRGTTGDAVLDAKMRAAGLQILAQARSQAPGWMAEHDKRSN